MIWPQFASLIGHRLAQAYGALVIIVPLHIHVAYTQAAPAMTDKATPFRSRVATDDIGEPGLLVVIVDAAKNILATATTGPDGMFALVLPAGVTPDELHVLTAQHGVIAPFKWPVAEPIRLPQTPTDDERFHFTHVSGPLLIDPLAPALLGASVLSRVASDHDCGCGKPRASASRGGLHGSAGPHDSVTQLADVPDLLDIARRALHGSPLARRKFRSMLESLPSSAGPMRTAFTDGVRKAGKQARVLPQPPSGDDFGRLPRKHAAALFAATLVVSRGRADAEKLLGSLDTGLMGAYAGTFQGYDEAGGYHGGGSFFPCGSRFGDEYEDNYSVDLWHSIRYRIDSIEPIEACPGDHLTIEGQGFHPGGLQAVVFPGCDGGEVRVEASDLVELTDDKIVVAMPARVGEGEVHLDITTAIVNVCGDFVDSIGAFAEQTKSITTLVPVLGSLTINGRDSDCAVPGTPLHIAWDVCPSTARVYLSIAEAGVMPVPAVGTHVLTPPYASPSGSFDIVLSAWFPAECSRHGVAELRTLAKRTVYFGPPPRLKVAGVEKTQGIQSFWQNVFGVPVRDNSLPLINYKDTILRVFVDVDRDGVGNDEASIRGTARIRLPDVGDVQLEATNPVIRVGRLDRSRRQETEYSLNFRIPLAFAHHTRVVDIDLEVIDYCEPRPRLATSVAVQFDAVAPAPVRFIRVASGGNTWRDEVAEAAVVRGLDLLPTPPLDVAGIGGFIRARPSEYPDSGHMGGELSDLEDVASAFEDVALALAITPVSHGGYSNCGWAAISAQSHETIGHELGHSLGLGHVDDRVAGCSACGIGCEDYPSLIQDVPIDPRTAEIVGPTVRALMGYLRPRWTAPEEWLHMWAQIRHRFFWNHFPLL